MAKEKMTEQELNELALKVKDLLVEAGATRPDEDQEIEGFVTVPEICETLEMDKSQWKPVQLRMFLLGDALSVMPGRGFYNGVAGEQASCVIYRVKVAKALLESASEIVKAGREAGQLKHMLPYLEEDLGGELGGLPQLVSIINEGLGRELDQALLTDGSTD